MTGGTYRAGTQPLCLGQQPTRAPGQTGPPFPAAIQAGTQGGEGPARLGSKATSGSFPFPRTSGCSQGPTWRGPQSLDARPRVTSVPSSLGPSSEAIVKTQASQVM